MDSMATRTTPRTGGGGRQQCAIPSLEPGATGNGAELGEQAAARGRQRVGPMRRRADVPNNQMKRSLHCAGGPSHQGGGSAGAAGAQRGLSAGRDPHHCWHPQATDPDFHHQRQVHTAAAAVATAMPGLRTALHPLRLASAAKHRAYVPTARRPFLHLAADRFPWRHVLVRALHTLVSCAL